MAPASDKDVIQSFRISEITDQIQFLLLNVKHLQEAGQLLPQDRMRIEGGDVATLEGLLPTGAVSLVPGKQPVTNADTIPQRWAPFEVFLREQVPGASYESLIGGKDGELWKKCANRQNNLESQLSSSASVIKKLYERNQKLEASNQVYKKALHDFKQKAAVRGVVLADFDGVHLDDHFPTQEKEEAEQVCQSMATVADDSPQVPPKSKKVKSKSSHSSKSKTKSRTPPPDSAQQQEEKQKQQLDEERPPSAMAGWEGGEGLSTQDREIVEAAHPQDPLDDYLAALMLRETEGNGKRRSGSGEEARGFPSAAERERLQLLEEIGQLQAECEAMGQESGRLRARVMAVENELEILQDLGLCQWQAATVGEEESWKREVEAKIAAAKFTLRRLVAKGALIEDDRNRLQKAADEQTQLQQEQLSSYLQEKNKVIERLYDSLQFLLAYCQKANSVVSVRHPPESQSAAIAAANMYTDYLQTHESALKLAIEHLEISCKRPPYEGLPILPEILLHPEVFTFLEDGKSLLHRFATLAESNQLTMHCAKELFQVVSEVTLRFRILQIEVATLRDHAKVMDDAWQKERKQLCVEKAILRESVETMWNRLNPTEAIPPSQMKKISTYALMERLEGSVGGAVSPMESLHAKPAQEEMKGEEEEDQEEEKTLVEVQVEVLEPHEEEVPLAREQSEMTSPPTAEPEAATKVIVPEEEEEEAEEENELSDDEGSLSERENENDKESTMAGLEDRMPDKEEEVSVL